MNELNSFIMSSIKIRRSIVAATIAVSVILAWPVSGQEKYNLRYEFEPGKSAIYHKFVEGVVRETSGDKVIHLQFLDNWEVASGDQGDGLFTVRQTGSEYQNKGAKFDFREYGLPAENEPIERLMDTLGRIESVSHYQKGSRYFINCLTFPGAPVAVGESWKYSPAVTFTPYGRTVSAPVNLIYTLENIIRYKGRICAKISVNGSYLYKNQAGDILLVGEITGRAYFDLENNIELDYEIKEVRSERSPTEKLQKNMMVKVTSLKK